MRKNNKTEGVSTKRHNQASAPFGNTKIAKVAEWKAGLERATTNSDLRICIFERALHIFFSGAHNFRLGSMFSLHALGQIVYTKTKRVSTENENMPPSQKIEPETKIFNGQSILRILQSLVLVEARSRPAFQSATYPIKVMPHGRSPACVQNAKEPHTC